MKLTTILQMREQGQIEEALESFEKTVEWHIRKGKVLYVVQNNFSMGTPYDVFIRMADFTEEAIDEVDDDLKNPSGEEKMLMGSYNSIAGNSLNAANKINPLPNVLKREGNFFKRAGDWTRDVSRMFSAGSYLSAAKAYKNLYDMLENDTIIPKIDRLVTLGLDPTMEAVRIFGNGVKMKQNLDENHPSRVRIQRQYAAALRMKENLEELIIQ